MENEKPDYHLDQWGNPQKVNKHNQQFTKQGSGDVPEPGDVVAADGDNIEVEENTLGFIGDFSGFDWDMAFKENAIPVTEYSKVVEDNKEQIEEAEKELGELGEALYKAFGESHELDINRLRKASEEELNELWQAISKTHEIQDAQAEIDQQKQLLDGIQAEWGPKLGGIWKGKYDVDLEEYPNLEASIPGKIQWLEENKPYGYEGKVEALKGFKEAYWKHHAEKDILAELEAGSPKGNLSEYQKIIEKFQNPNDLYSLSRKDKAVWCKSQEESMKQFGAVAAKQWASFTYEEQNTMRNYTGSGSATINRPLRAIKHSSGWGSSGKKKGLQMAKLMTSALDKCKSEKDVWLQRGVSDMKFGGFDFADLLSGKVTAKSIVGREFIDNGFMSCGSAKGTGFSSQDVILNIYCPRGTKMQYMEPYTEVKYENETIIQRGYHYRITKVTKKGKSGFYVDVDLILGSDADKFTDKQMEKMYEKYL